MHIGRLGSIGLTAGLVASVGILPASADVDVFAMLDKDKTISINEDVLKDKAIFIRVAPMLVPEGAAEAEAIVNAFSEGNTNLLNDTTDRNLNFDATITASILDNSGIVGVNQDVGNFVNQGNVVAFALTDSPTSFADAQAWTDQTNWTNSLIQIENDTVTVDLPGKPAVGLLNESRTAAITDSINGNAGIVGVNQNAGDVNNQHNSVALSVGLGSIAALSESALGQRSENNTISETNVARSNTITASVVGNNGITAVNQTSGNFNNQASVVSFAAVVSSVAINTPPI